MAFYSLREFFFIKIDFIPLLYCPKCDFTTDIGGADLLSHMTEIPMLCPVSDFQTRKKRRVTYATERDICPGLDLDADTEIFYQDQMCFATQVKSRTHN